VSLALRCTQGALTGELIEIDHELLLGRELPGISGLGGDPKLSRRHARVFVQGSRLIVEDLGSTNGTWVNDQRLTGPHQLQVGDRLRLGQTGFEVCETQQHVATELEAAPPAASDAPRSAPYLEVVAGPMAGRQIALGSELAIGRSFAEPGGLGGDSQLSRRHARVARGSGGAYFLQDTGSTNGTILNGERLRQTQVLGDGDEIKVGSTTLVAHGLPRSPLSAESDAAHEHSAAHGYADAAPPEVAGRRAFAPQGAARARLGSRRLILAFASVFVAAMIVGVAAVVLATPPGSRTCPTGFVCLKPTTGPPLQALATFRGALGWRAEYDPQLLQASTTNATGNELVLHESDHQDHNWGLAPGSDLIGIEVRAFAADQVSAATAMKSLGSSLSSQLIGAATAPNSDQMFDSPALGFHSGVGEVLEGNAQTPQGPGGLVKVATLAATSGNVTIAAGVVYSVQRAQNQQSNPDRVLDELGDQVIETVRFPSDGAT
jgi:pSer/pThr/pTyr-binding forkhead associated (FHA) protein